MEARATKRASFSAQSPVIVDLMLVGLPGWWWRRGMVKTTLTIAIGWLDLLIAALITVATLLIGQAIVAYEIFTGYALPRREFRRQWHNAIILAGGYGLAVECLSYFFRGPKF